MDLQVTICKENGRVSVALYDYVPPVYKNEYRELARLYDEGASEESITSCTKFIHDKYYSVHMALFGKLVSAGKPYAEKHNIKVSRDIHDPPR
jgi:hypothetical protein